MTPVDESATRHIVAALITTFLAASPVLADPPHGKGKGKHRDEDAAASSSRQITVSITVEQARRIALDVGARGYKPLPPGIRKNLARGKPLPPGIAKRYAPATMVTRLPVYSGHEWRVVGTDLVLVAIATAVVVDILIDVFS